MFTFVTIAYQLPYYTQHANIYYHTKKNKYYLFLPGNRYITIGHNDLQKGEIYADGYFWKFTTLHVRNIEEKENQKDLE